MSQSNGDIAIIGMACVYAGAPNVEAFWRNILSKVDSVSDPPDSFGADGFFDPSRIYCRRGGFIEESTDFNPDDFGVKPQSLDGGDPEHFMALRIAREALADAGYLDRAFDRERTAMVLGCGVFLNRGTVTALQHGMIVDQTLHIIKRLHPQTSEADLQAVKQELIASLPPFNADTCEAVLPIFLSGSIANHLDLRGPILSVDTTCAPSLIAVDMAINELRSHRCDMAIVGGTQVHTPAPVFMVFCELGALSRRGRIRPFDSDPDGILLGEGIGMMVIKRREDAERDGDRIYAIIKGVGVANQGQATDVLAPRMEGQLLALERAYEVSGVSPETIAMIEAHGTGTAVGDVMEIHALTRLFGSRKGKFPGCCIGSIKSMIGHSMAAAGMDGLIKTVLGLYHKILPPTLCDKPNPELELEKTPFYVNSETRPWIHGESKPRRAGVNAFGFGGISAHAVLEEYTGSDGTVVPPSLVAQWDTEVIILQAESRDNLIGEGERLLRFISATMEVELKDLAYTFNCPLRDAARYRLAIVTDSPKDLEKKLRYALKRLSDPQCPGIKDRSGIFFFEEPLSTEGKLAFVFPGEGSQYVNMLSDLCIHFPEVMASFDMADRIFINAGQEPLPSQVVFPPPHASSETRAAFEQALWMMEYADTTVCAANQGMNDLLGRLEMWPQVVVGHSIGEHAALMASGIFVEQGEEEMLQFLLEVNKIHKSATNQIPVAKLMAVGAADPSLVASIVAESGGKLYAAMDNCPNQVVLCGSEGAIDGAYERLKKKGAICNFLPFDRGYHTPLYRPLCDLLVPLMKRMTIQAPRIEIYSCATTRPYPQDPDEIRRIIVDQWAQPVRFRETIEAMYDAGVRIFVEVGARGNITSFVEDILGGRRYLAVAANVTTCSGITQLNHMVGLLAAHCVPMRLDYLYVRRKPRLLPIQESVEKGGEESLDRAEKTRQKTGAMKLRRALPWLTLEERAPSISPDGGDPSQRVPATPEEREAMVVARQMEPPHAAGGQSRIRDRVMREYLQTMERFLLHQQEIMEVFAKRKRTKKSQAPVSEQNFALRPDEPKRSVNLGTTDQPMAQNATEQARDSSAPHGPLGIVVSSLIPEKELAATYQVDLDEHIYMRHQTLGRCPSNFDDTLIGLPVVPLAFSAEIMAQAASLLVPDKKIIAVTDVRAHNWIEVGEDAPSKLHITARRNESPARDEVEVKVMAAGCVVGSESGAVAGPIFPVISSSGPPGNQLLTEGRIVFGDVYPHPPQIENPLVRTGEPCNLRSEEIYRRMLFHGPIFHGVTSIDSMGDQGVEATLVAPPDVRLFRSVEDPKLHIDPLLLDIAGHVPACWALKSLDTGFIAFPSGFKALRIYGPSPQSPDPIKCYARSNASGDHILTNLDMIDSKGRLFMQIEGWENVRFFDWTHRFHTFTLAPCSHQLSDSWTAPIAQLPDSNGVQSSLCSEWGGGIWQRVLAYTVLNRAERETWKSIPGGERRRQEWLIGRMTAKDAVRFLLKDRYRMEACPADIEISTDEYGQPAVSGELVANLGCHLSLSIAHSGQTAVAVVGECGKGRRGIGIDVEHVGQSHNGLEAAALTGAERSLLDGVPASKRQQWLVRLWCAKEAVAKALGRGMMGNPHNLVVTDLSMETGRVDLKIAGRLAQELPDDVDKFFTAYTGCDETLVFAISFV
jgi:acyl transferase domain-containing protein/phosphopantetheinyl transferase